jgi:hypothetical protein
MPEPRLVPDWRGNAHACHSYVWTIRPGNAEQIKNGRIMEDITAYHRRRASEHRKMAERTRHQAHAEIHTELADMHEAAVERQGHALAIAQDR